MGKENTNDNNMKGMKDKFNENIKIEIQNHSDKKDNIEDEKKDLKRSKSKINLPLISSSEESIHNSPSEANTSSPPSLSSSFKILPPIWNIIKVLH